MLFALSPSMRIFDCSQLSLRVLKEFANTMESFFNELKDLIASYTSVSDLQSFRLTNKSLHKSATRELFFRIHVTPCTSSISNFQSILSSPALAKQVTSVKLTTYSDPDKDFEHDGHQVEASTLTYQYERVIRSINLFPNLRNVTLEFPEACDVRRPGQASPDMQEGAQFRSQVLSALFDTLDDLQEPLRHLQSLSLKNLQNYNDASFVSLLNFKSVLQSISELHLSIITESHHWQRGNSWAKPELYTFFSELPDTWLKPAQQNLTSLTLHCGLFWGYIAKCDLRSIHFPSLKKLELGNYIFSHDWQVDWICSHTSLEALTLDNCCILSYTQAYGPVDEEGYYIDPAGVSGNYESDREENPHRWSEIFTQIEHQLPNLKMFQFGSVEWQDVNNFETNGLPERWIKLHDDPYIAFV